MSVAFAGTCEGLAKKINSGGLCVMIDGYVWWQQHGETLLTGDFCSQVVDKKEKEKEKEMEVWFTTRSCL